MKTNEVIQGDCAWAMDDLPEGSVQLVFTSPPYAMQRKGVYEGVAADGYVDWFCERADQFERVLALTGSFVLNIKEHSAGGERHPYVYELVLALRARGWRLIDEYIWHKPNPMPGLWNERLKDGWERCLHFAASSMRVKFNRDAVRQPIKTDSGNGHLLAQMQDGVKRKNKIIRSGSEFSYDRHKKVEKERAKKHGGVLTALPSNVLSITNKLHSKDHPATFPVALPEFFIKLLTDRDDLVVDPFCGSGTTCVAAQRLGRRWIGVDISDDYVKLARREIAAVGMV